MNEDILNKYELTVGMEIHVQLKTKTKLFAPVDNDAREAMPNTTVSEICFGLPGTLPVLNKKAVHLAVRAGHALESKINLFSKFDRKHYFYPDLPMGYQISQFDQPIVGSGKIKIKLKSGEEVEVGITRAHLEADAGKLTHPTGADHSLVDLNRAGTPLIEIVSEPDIHSAEAAKAFAREINLRMRYADVSYANLYYGNMRFDVNISLAPKGSKTLGTRAEIKNLNSFRAVENSINYEVKRQAELLDSGQKVVQETRGWDDSKNQTFSQRSKEDAHDYRYMPEPDIPPIILTQDYVDSVAKEVDINPQKIREALEALNLDYSQTETLVERIPFAKVLCIRQSY
jgi:aspartyl-tRNA(Asn)/glutamyl-tRNA(Gln) amidotransferase subunit B